MKLKPSVFQLIVLLMTSTLIVSCNTYQPGSQVDCNDPKLKQSQECNPSSTGSSRGVHRSGGSSTIVAPLQGGNSGNSTSGNDGGTGANSANSTGNSSSDSSSTSKSSSSSGRGGFGSSSSGKSGGLISESCDGYRYFRLSPTRSIVSGDESRLV